MSGEKLKTAQTDDLLLYAEFVFSVHLKYDIMIIVVALHRRIRF